MAALGHKLLTPQSSQAASTQSPLKPLPTARPATANTKRGAGEIRNEFLLCGATLLSFKTGEGVSPLSEKQWRAMEQYGFQVTERGCLLPYKFYQRSSKGAHTLKGHQRAAAFFIGRRADPTPQRNPLGWDATECVSHLCHHPDCARPDHLVIEEKWRNWKRNYCGLNGVCDCGNPVRCIATYASPQYWNDNPPTILQTKTARVKALEDLPAKWKATIRSKNFYHVQDQKAENRRLRKARKRKHDAEGAKKRKRTEKSTKSNRKRRKVEHYATSGRGAGAGAGAGAGVGADTGAESSSSDSSNSSSSEDKGGGSSDPDDDFV